METKYLRMKENQIKNKNSHLSALKLDLNLFFGNDISFFKQVFKLSVESGISLFMYLICTIFTAYRLVF